MSKVEKSHTLLIHKLAYNSCCTPIKLNGVFVISSQVLAPLAYDASDEQVSMLVAQFDALMRAAAAAGADGQPEDAEKVQNARACVNVCAGQVLCACVSVLVACSCVLRPLAPMPSPKTPRRCRMRVLCLRACDACGRARA